MGKAFEALHNFFYGSKYVKKGEIIEDVPDDIGKIMIEKHVAVPRIKEELQPEADSNNPEQESNLQNPEQSVITEPQFDNGKEVPVNAKSRTTKKASQD